jgi:cell division protein FtsW (lipid II flippase)
MSARARELFGLLPVSLLVTGGFTAVLITRSDVIETVTVTYGGIFLGCCVFAHLFIRARLPDADPYLFPLAALLAAFGLVMIYRIDETKAGEQAVVFGLGLALFVATIVFLRDHRVLERYRYTIAAAGIGLLLAPRLPGIGEQVNGAYLGVGLGPLSFQPAEFGKLAIVIFLASYLNETREVLVRGRVPRISMKHLGPLLVVWGAAMVMLVFIRDLGSSLMFFGAFLALLYVATARLSLVAGGFAMFAAGAWFFANTVGHVRDRIDIWLDPFAPNVVDDEGYQIAQSLFAQADGGLFGVGFGESLLRITTPGGDTFNLLPAADTDLIYAIIVNELGLFGASAVILTYMLFAARGFKTAVMATDGFSKLLAAGLTAVFALQVFVIVGGVTRVIPLTGVTLPFISFGGSSIIANFVLIALLLIVSDHARRDRGLLKGGLV